MFSGFFGKGSSADKTPPKEAPDSRGLEVVEDDPDTAWSMWDNALAEQDSRFPPDIEASAAAGAVPDPTPAPRAQAKPMPPVSSEMQATVPMSLEPHEPTQPLDLQDKTLEQRKNDALDIVDLHHHRIANTIRTMWGYKECSIYINKLVMAGGDGMGQARIGFNMEAVQAMLALIDLHDAQFGAPDTGGGLGFADPTIRSGIEGYRRG
ncbi:hypothetical protein [Rhodoferax saidenbachensis]|uniref:Uncharacterized protein n=1 Tax=Rhodoferax saidenbachensis TaxID=1484693 RepID=A0A1P8K690_9BURK|nr:hypothetical protein [Rhodoferax saidenbachensis]APW41530.1 hypothetical protein RS694_02490 [Rhodoferax saidenbachensis]